MNITEGMTFAEYRAIDAVNWSTLKAMAKSAAHYRHALTHDFSNARMDLGSAAHAALLEPDQFPLRYAVFDGARRAGKDWEAFKAANEGRIILKSTEYAQCLRVRDAVMANPTAAALLDGRSEVVIEWTDAETGIACKARPDHLTASGALVDFKTTGSVDADDFMRLAARMLYHGQVAFYNRSLVTSENPRIIAAEIEAPHDMAVFAYTDAAWSAGDTLVSELLRRVAMYREMDKWPGRYASEVELDLPSWMLEQDDPDGWDNLPERSME